ncbi:MAG: aminotransferase class V-fold PLP-dependent enzyme, partial [Acidimicrobiia bacterium]|nr:aminotransferase class V-fold PLP-dependent enzyme [Acidimicrobiia bacterium]
EDVGGTISTDELARLVDSRTAVIATSLVQSATGFRVDVDSVKDIAHDAGSWLVMDASQAIGAIDVDVDGIDALFACSHKWLLGIRGMGHLYVSPELNARFVPLTPGWKSTQDPMTSFYGPEFELAGRASKLDASFGWFDAIANLEGLRIIESFGIAEIEAHSLSLVDELEEAGVPIAFERNHRSPIVSIDVKSPDDVVGELGKRSIIGSLRAGRLRVSVHLYNTSQDIAALAEALSS